MYAHLVRIGPDIIRIPLLCVFWPPMLLVYVLTSCMPTCIGGHPNKRRLLEWGFYALPIALFWDAWDGLFVPD